MKSKKFMQHEPIIPAIHDYYDVRVYGNKSKKQIVSFRIISLTGWIETELNRYKNRVKLTTKR